MIKLVNIKMEYDKKVVLDNINLTVAPGETVALLDLVALAKVRY